VAVVDVEVQEPLEPSQVPHARVGERPGLSPSPGEPENRLAVFDRGFAESEG
jgi:hypothetical protein